jgi:hypothetical protein
MKMYRVEAREGRIVEVECQSNLYRTQDADGRTVYENTHFLEEAAAVRRLMADCEAGVHLAADAMEQAREEVRRCEKHCADASIAWRKAKVLWEEKVL